MASVSDQDPAPLEEGFVCHLDFEPGWVDLTLADVTKEGATALAVATANQLNPLSLEIQKQAVIDDMTDRALERNVDLPVMVAAYYAESGEALVTMDIDAYGDEGVPRPAREEVGPLLLEWANAEVVGKPDITYLDLPAGPAVRVQATLKTRRLLGLGKRLSEFIRYAVFPPDMESLVIATATWEKIQRTEEITALVDAMVPTMRLSPTGAGGVGTGNTPGDADGPGASAHSPK
ncbi:hypothetical protein [Streptomyces tsukubensis]|uniref:Uncharacterized protein n=1 Tax=Streptomyces tsukubensis TaxID=83656 RepID=A0A1V4A871_9ACTN|nr:hypothetical protein [Streptomyces tsukubensis]OON78392.1 hypothetical protein B1H18_16530 [Streptomyces tsukubensis]QFR95156.1 hypothetical protein GBW32_21690 [Streptomyces tsukubensis]